VLVKKIIFRLFLFYFLEQILSILKFNNFSIFDSNGNLPINLTNDKNIKNLINKFDKPKKKKKNRNNIEGPYSFLSNFEFIPPKPPKTFGFLKKMGRFVLNFHYRFIEIDPIMGALRRYKTREEYPSNPL
jgi:hypothetical protein